MIENQKSAFPWGPVIGGASSLAGAISNIGQRKKQHERNIELWKMNNDYNHPSSQMARLREAGLNPNLIYGDSVSGASGQSGSPPPTAEKRELDLGDPVGRYQNIKGTGLQNDNLRAQNTLLQNQAAKTAAETLLTATNTGLKGRQLDMVNRTFETQIEKLNSEAGISLANHRLADQKFLQTNFDAAQIKQIKDANLLSIINKAKQSTQNLGSGDKLNLLREAELKLKNSQIKFYESKAILGIISQIMGLK